VSDVGTRVNRAKHLRVRASIFPLSSACLVGISVPINLYVQQTFMFFFSYFHYRTCDSLVGIMRMPRERRRRIPGSSTDKGKIFTFSTKHPDQYIQWVGGGRGNFSLGKVSGA